MHLVKLGFVGDRDDVGDLQFLNCEMINHGNMRVIRCAILKRWSSRKCE